jgi:hypothetical protein
MDERAAKSFAVRRTDVVSNEAARVHFGLMDCCERQFGGTRTAVSVGEVIRGIKAPLLNLHWYYLRRLAAWLASVSIRNRARSHSWRSMLCPGDPEPRRLLRLLL